LAGEVADADWVVRAIPDEELDKDTGKITSFSFNNSHLSVSLLSEQSIRNLLARRRYAYIAAINAGFCRTDLGVEVVPDPLPDNPDHVLIHMPVGRGSRAAKLKGHAPQVSAIGDPATVYQQLLAAIASLQQPPDDEMHQS